jgi:hypothetical protein
MMKRSASREKDSRISFRRLPHLARKSFDGASMALDADYAARLAPGAPRVILLIAFGASGRGYSSGILKKTSVFLQSKAHIKRGMYKMQPPFRFL